MVHLTAQSTQRTESPERSERTSGHAHPFTYGCSCSQCRISRNTSTPVPTHPAPARTDQGDMPSDLVLPEISERFTCRNPRTMLLFGESQGMSKKTCCGKYTCSNRRNRKARSVAQGVMRHWTDGGNSKRWIIDVDNDYTWEIMSRLIRRIRQKWVRDGGTGVIPSYVTLRRDNNSDARVIITNVELGYPGTQVTDAQSALDYIVANIVDGPIANVQNPDWKMPKEPPQYVAVNPGDYETSLEVIHEAGFRITGMGDVNGTPPDPMLVANGWASPLPRDVYFDYPLGMTQMEAKELAMQILDDMIEDSLDE